MMPDREKLIGFMWAAVVRTVRTMAQTFASLLAAGEWLGLFDVDWRGICSASALAGVLCFATCIGFGIPEANKANRQPVELTNDEAEEMIEAHPELFAYDGEYDEDEDDE